MATMIEVGGLTKRFGARTVLNHLDFTVEAGERLALLGLNGAGKTTLLRCLMGVLSFRGSIRIDGIDVTKDGRRARGLIGYVPQRAPVLPMTLGETVDFFAALRGIPAAAVAERLEALDMSLHTSQHLALRELSGGMLQKALLAIALAADPAVLLLDEPTANLDPQARRELLRAIRNVNPETTVILASHRLDEIETVASRVWILHGRDQAFDGSLDDLRGRAGTDGWLWVRTTAEKRDAAREEFCRHAGRDAVMANGTRVAVLLPAADRARALSDLARAGIPVEDFWVERPSLEEIVHGFFERNGT